MALIEREALLSAAIDVEVIGGTIRAVPAGIIRYAPTIDAAPVVHGRWIHDGPNVQGGVDWWHCSACFGRESGVYIERPYCSLCGARMDGGEGHEAD